MKGVSLWEVHVKLPQVSNGSMVVLSMLGLQYIWLCHNCLCDIDNNWVLLLFTSCTLLTLSLDLVGGMGTCEANPSQLGRHS